MELLGADAYFGAESEFKAVREPCGSVYIYAGCVHMLQEIPGVVLVLRYDGVRMLRVVFIDIKLMLEIRR